MDWKAEFTRVNRGIGEPTFHGEQLPVKMVRLSAVQAAQALDKAYKKVTGRRPSWKILLLMLAQTGLETGQWNLPTNNWGGVKYNAKVDKFFQYLKCGEVIDGVHIEFPAGDPHCIFAAYKTPEDGAERYVRTLKGRSSWWNGLHTGTLEGFIDGLTPGPGQNYFTANKAKYMASMNAMMKQFRDVAYRYGSHLCRNILIAAPIIGAGAFLGYRKIHGT